MAVHERDGYAAIKALLPPSFGAAKFARGLVLIDPPYEAQLDEFDTAIGALREGLARWPQATYALWYPIKLRRALQPFYRRAETCPAKSSLVAELLVRPDDSPLRMNGSGLLLLNPPWQFDADADAGVDAAGATLGEAGARGALDWLKQDADGAAIRATLDAAADQRAREARFPARGRDVSPACVRLEEAPAHFGERLLHRALDRVDLVDQAPWRWRPRACAPAPTPSRRCPAAA